MPQSQYITDRGTQISQAPASQDVKQQSAIEREKKEKEDAANALIDLRKKQSKAEQAELDIEQAELKAASKTGIPMAPTEQAPVPEGLPGNIGGSLVSQGMQNLAAPVAPEPGAQEVAPAVAPQEPAAEPAAAAAPAPQQYLSDLEEGFFKDSFNKGGIKKSPEQIELENRLRERMSESMAQSQGVLSEQETELRKKIEEIHAGSDVKPFLQFVDDFTGSSLAKGFEGKADKLKDAEAIQKHLLKQRAVLTKIEIDGITKQLKSMADKNAMKMYLEGNKNWRSYRNVSTRIVKKYQTPLMKEITLAMPKKMSALNSVAAHVDSGQVGRILPALTKIAREIGEEKGNMSEGDVQRQLVSSMGMDWAVLKAYFNDPSARLPLTVIQPLKDIIMTAKIETKRMYIQKMKNMRGNMANDPVVDDLLRGGLTKMFDSTAQQIEGFYPEIDINSPLHGTTPGATPTGGLRKPSQVEAADWSAMNAAEKQEVMGYFK